MLQEQAHQHLIAMLEVCYGDTLILPRRSYKNMSDILVFSNMPSCQCSRFAFLSAEVIPATRPTVSLIKMMNRTIQLLSITSLAATLAQARAPGRHHQRDAPADSNPSLYITTDRISRTSPLLLSSDIHPRVPINVILSNATTIASSDTLIIAADATSPLYDWIAQKITASSDSNSCTLVYGTDFDGEVWEGFAYQTISTGLNCDTTASRETIRATVGECADWLHEARAVRGCCRIRYGGTRDGRLRLTAEADGWPAADC